VLRQSGLLLGAFAKAFRLDMLGAAALAVLSAGGGR
jgi:hypothetical protein